MYSSQIKRRNLKFVFIYLKECYTITQFARSGNTGYISKCRVKVDDKGYPKIIPVILRNQLHGSKSLYISVLTILGLHRVIPYWPDVDLASIVNPFNGISKTLDLPLLIRAKSNLCKLAKLPKGYKLKLAIPKGLVLLSAGPNHKHSQWSVIEDALAFYHEPKVLLCILRWFIINKSPLFFPFILLLVFGLPYYIIHLYWYGRPRFQLGRLGVVYNTAGKARVVAMTNWWIQCALKPLHNSIFRFLKNLQTDGTFNQMAPIKALIDKGPGDFFSLDLSAATDRLPIDLQERVLSLFTDKQTASMWRTLMSIPFFFKGDLVRYSVGQPMGAYSSWAMLALTHHMVVQCTDRHPFSEYAILGDDVVIKGKANADSYLSIMKTLGVDISLPKSMISVEFMEFAKRMINICGEDFSILGPGLILSVIKNRSLSGLLVTESFLKGFVDSIPDAVRLLERLCASSSDALSFPFGLYSLFGLTGTLVGNHDAVSLERVTWLTLPFRVDPKTLRYLVYNAVCALFLDKSRKSVAIAKKGVEEFTFFKFAPRVSTLVLVITYLPLRIVSPGPWLLLSSVIKASEGTPIPKLDGSWTSIVQLIDELKLIKLESLDSMRRQDVLDITRSYRFLEREIIQGAQDLSICSQGDFY